MIGSKYKFPKVTVTGTSNLIMASVFVKGAHYVKNISIEPEVLDLIKFLNNAGAKIKFLGKRSIKITGVKELINGKHKLLEIELKHLVIYALVLLLIRKLE